MNQRPNLASCLFVTIFLFSFANLCVAEKIERQSGWSALGGGLSEAKGARLNYEPRKWPNLWLKSERAPRASC